MRITVRSSSSKQRFTADHNFRKEARALTTEDLSGQYVSSQGANGYLCLPRASTEAGLLLLPHVTGLGADMCREAASFATLGYTTFVWDPYPGIHADATAREQLPQLNDDAAAAEQSRCVDYLLQQTGVKRVGAVGWCMGGRMALVFASRETRLNVCAAYYPSMRDTRKPGEADAALEAGNVGCPLQVVYPGLDHVTSHSTFERYRNALAACQQPTFVQIYPEAHHGFLSEHRQQESSADARAAQVAWPQTLALLRASLAPANS